MSWPGLAVPSWIVTSVVPCTSPSHIRVPEAGVAGDGSGSGAGLGRGLRVDWLRLRSRARTRLGSVSSLTVYDPDHDGLAHRILAPSP